VLYNLQQFTQKPSISCQNGQFLPISRPLLTPKRPSCYHRRIFSSLMRPNNQISSTLKKGLLVGTCKVPGCSLPDTGRNTKKYKYLCQLHYVRCAMAKLDSLTFRKWYKQDCEVIGCSNTAMDFDHWHGHHIERQAMCKLCFRGHICRSCNVALGHNKDNIERLQARAVLGDRRSRWLANYLILHPAPQLKYKEA
jgi:hypothetical protein